MPHLPFSIANADGGEILVEVTTPRQPLGLQQAEPQSAANEPTRVLEESLAILKPMAKAFQESLAGFDADRISVEFGCNLTSEGQLVVFRGTANVNFKISITWRNAGQPSGS